MERDSPVLICGPVKGSIAVVAGSIISFCFSCGDEVFVSKSGQAQIERNPSTVVKCTTCLAEIVKNDPSLVGYIGPVEGAYEELKENFPDSY
jgi:hypothetical protein